MRPVKSAHPSGASFKQEGRKPSKLKIAQSLPRSKVYQSSANDRAAAAIPKNHAALRCGPEHQTAAAREYSRLSEILGSGNSEEVAAACIYYYGIGKVLRPSTIAQNPQLRLPRITLRTPI